MVEFGGTQALTYAETWNNNYVTKDNNSNTAVIYGSDGPDNSHGNVNGITIITQYCVLIARQRITDGYNPVATFVWLQTISGNVISTATITNNYIDPNGALVGFLYVYPPDGGSGYIGAGSTWTGNINLNDGSTITGTFGSGTSTMVCNQTVGTRKFKAAA